MGPVAAQPLLDRLAAGDGPGLERTKFCKSVNHVDFRSYPAF
jgi:hypothetical protein